MNKLTIQLQRLYFLDEQQWLSERTDDGGRPAYTAAGALTPEIVASSLAGELNVGLNLVSAAGMVRAMVVRFERAGDWERVGGLYQAVQDELDLPAPAVSISGRKGYRLWLSLAEPIPVAQAVAFLAALRARYLADLAAAHLDFCPDADPLASAGSGVVELVPARHLTTGKWSAFIDPSMGSMFVDEPGLEMAPGMDRQADMLARLECIKAGDFQRALSILLAPVETDAQPGLSPIEGPADLPGEAASRPSPAARHPPSKLNVGNNFTDPESFLLAVMNDSSASARQRIRAAKALLPYFARGMPK